MTTRHPHTERENDAMTPRLVHDHTDPAALPLDPDLADLGERLPDFVTVQGGRQVRVPSQAARIARDYGIPGLDEHTANAQARILAASAGSLGRLDQRESAAESAADALCALLRSGVVGVDADVQLDAKRAAEAWEVARG